MECISAYSSGQCDFNFVRKKLHNGPDMHKGKHQINRTWVNLHSKKLHIHTESNTANGKSECKNRIKQANFLKKHD